MDYTPTVAFIQLQPAQEIVDQLAGRDVAVIMAIGVVFMAIAVIVIGLYLIRSAQSNAKLADSTVSMARSINHMTKSMDRRVIAAQKRDESMQSALTQLIETNTLRTTAADKAYQEIFALRSDMASANIAKVMAEIHDSTTQLQLIGGHLAQQLQLTPNDSSKE